MNADTLSVQIAGTTVLNAGIELRVTFSCAHFYNQTQWDSTQNKSKFGKCYSQFGHGHDYVLCVGVAFAQQELLRKKLIDLHELLDHKHLNHEIEYFQDKIPTCEVIAYFCKSYLEDKSDLKVLSVRLYERPDLWVEI